MDRNSKRLADDYCERALAVGRLMRAAYENPEGSRGLVKCARFHDERGYEILCSFLREGAAGAVPLASHGLARRQGGNGDAPHPLIGGLDQG